MSQFVCEVCGRGFEADKKPGERRRCSVECRRAAGYQEVRDEAWHLRVFYASMAVSSETGCWEWQRAHTPDGYGVRRWSGRLARAHRVSYELNVGPIPAGLTLDHLCRRPACCNPAHLEPVTLAENSRRQNRDRVAA